MSSAAVQSRPEALIRYLLEGTSSQTGQEFFRALVHSVALAMDVAGVWVTEYLPERKVLRSLAFWMNGQYIHDYECSKPQSVSLEWLEFIRHKVNRPSHPVGLLH